MSTIDSEFPDQCSDTCLDGLDWNGNHTSKHSTSKGNGKDEGAITVTKETIIGVAVAVLLLFIIALLAVYCITRHRRIKREIERQEEIIVSAEKYTPMIENDDDMNDNTKDQQIAGGAGTKNTLKQKIMDLKKNKSGGKITDESTEIVYSDKNDEIGNETGTIGGDSNNTNNNNNNVSSERATFATMTDDMSIENAVQKDETDIELDIHDDIAAVEPLSSNDSNDVEEAPAGMGVYQNGVHKELKQGKNGHVPLPDNEDDADD